MTTHRVFSKLRFLPFSQTKRKQLSANYKKCLEIQHHKCAPLRPSCSKPLWWSPWSQVQPHHRVLRWLVLGLRGKVFEIIVTILSWVKQLQKGEEDRRNRSQGEGSQYFADKNDGKPRVTESIGCLIRRVRKDLDKNKESHLESTLALWPEAVDKSWACWRVGTGSGACWRVGKEASLTMRERGSMLIWKRRIVIKVLRIIIQSSYLFLPHPPNEGLHKGSPGSWEMQRTELDAMSVWHSWSLEWDAFSYQRGGTLKIHNVW